MNSASAWRTASALCETPGLEGSRPPELLFDFADARAFHPIALTLDLDGHFYGVTDSSGDSYGISS